jgi:hypothetical protein
MGIVGKLKQVSVSTLEILKQAPPLVELFRSARYLQESAFWRQTTWTSVSVERTQKECQKEFERFRWADKHEQENLKNQFLAEWKIPELNLDKSWSELTFFLAGYVPCHISLSAVPELKRFRVPTQKNIFEKLFSRCPSYEGRDFLSFLVVEVSEWDGLPLVNAVGAGAEIGYEMGYGPMRYLLPDEIERVVHSLIKLSEEGFKERFWREAEKADPCDWIDWSDKEDLLEWMTELYSQTLNYYQDAVINQRAMLLYLT